MTSPTFTPSFEVEAADSTTTTFVVLSFEGVERISQPFEYRLLLRHSDPRLDFSKVLNQNATLVMTQEVNAPAIPAAPAVPADNTTEPPTPATPEVKAQAAGRVETRVPVKGIVSSFRANRMFKVNGTDYVEYEAVLVPKLW